MTVGIAATGLANKVLDGIGRSGSFPSSGTIYVKLHTGDPGTGASNASAVTTRASATFSAASAGSMALSNTPSWSMTTTETISHISLWDASSAGNLLWTGALTASKNVVNGDTLNLSTLTLSFTPVAA
jgi:hypothetical protein